MFSFCFHAKMPVSYQIGNGASPRHIPALCNDFGNEILYDEYFCAPSAIACRKYLASARASYRSGEDHPENVVPSPTSWRTAVARNRGFRKVGLIRLI